MSGFLREIEVIPGKVWHNRLAGHYKTGDTYCQEVSQGKDCNADNIGDKRRYFEQITSFKTLMIVRIRQG